MTQHSSSDSTRSRIALFGHPLHPMLVNFPIAFLTGAFAADLAWLATGDAFWIRAVYWLILAGLTIGAVAALGGLAELLLVPHARKSRLGWTHGLLNLAALSLAAWNLALRDGGEPSELAIVLSGAVTLMLAASSWLGGEMTFRHGVGASGGGHKS
jgi:uncharacterized membrane protein